MTKKLISIVLALVLVLMLGVPVFAAGNAETPVPAPPAEEFYDYGGGEPLGTYTPEELEEVRRLAAQACEECPQGRHYNLNYHIQEVTGITSSYVGVVEKGIVVSSSPSNTTTRVGYNRGVEVANTWSVSIGFAKEAVTASVGWDVELRNTYTATYETDVPAGKSCNIYMNELYNVKLFNTRTAYHYNTGSRLEIGYEYGTGWAQQFSRFDFRAVIF